MAAFSSTMAVTSPWPFRITRPYPVGSSSVVVISVAAAPEELCRSRSCCRVTGESRGVSPYSTISSPSRFCRRSRQAARACPVPFCPTCRTKPIPSGRQHRFHFLGLMSRHHDRCVRAAPPRRPRPRRVPPASSLPRDATPWPAWSACAFPGPPPESRPSCFTAMSSRS